MTRIDISMSSAAIAESGIESALAQPPISTSWTTRATRQRAGVSCPEIISSQATSCWRKRSRLKPTSAVRWRWQETLRRDGRHCDEDQAAAGLPLRAAATRPLYDLDLLSACSVA